MLSVSDGDTLKALCDEAALPQNLVTVRVASVDAPESNQPFGHRARQALTGLVLDKMARLECRGNPDRYGRSVCKVMVAPASCTREPCAKTLDAGLSMLTLGMAWWEPHFAGEQTPQERGQYEFAESEAKARHAGLWKDEEPVPPWNWRQEHPRPR
ncbi:thermonuclease family protein [Variovorax sp. dw_954]|uniref:thermonuclease family protein n=1 Tax=Variovorax sp. dw_954 TaxID=2720078 RepID=UPI0031F7139D